MTKSRGNPPPSVYNLQDKVLVRVSTGPRFSKRYAVILGIVVKRNADLSKYKVKFRMLGNPGHQHIKWFAVCDVSQGSGGSSVLSTRPENVNADSCYSPSPME
jgi:hypothetical protein